MDTFRAVRISLAALLLFPPFTLPPIVQAAPSEEQTASAQMPAIAADSVRSADRVLVTGFETFSIGPQWFLNALPGSTWIGAALALAAIGFTQRRRLRGLIARRA